MLQLIANGLCREAIYAIVALGFGLIVNVAGAFHIAHDADYASAGLVCHGLLNGVGLPLPLAIAGRDSDIRGQRCNSDQHR